MSDQTVGQISKFFEASYGEVERYWWLGQNRYSLNPADHTPQNRVVLQFALNAGGGRALDLGAGEGADAIRLAMAGFDVDAIELTEAGARKIEQFAAEAGVKVNVMCADLNDYVSGSQYDIIICNGVLHYIQDKHRVLDWMTTHTSAGGINSVSLFSTYTPLPACHTAPLFPDEEDGEVMAAYRTWDDLLTLLERDKPEDSHGGMPAHTHSYIKLVRRKTPGST